MRDWVPVPGSTKGKLALLALAEFGRRGYEPVNVTELAAAAGVTTGSLYHHFGNKAGLYSLVRDEAERRLLDRMEGAAAALNGRGDDAALRAGLLVGFDFAVGEELAAMLAEPHPERADDPVERFLATLTKRAVRPLPKLLAAAWRAALAEAMKGSAKEVRTALEALTAATPTPSRARGRSR
jgi:AcrR family transcriptional regulator